MGSGKSTVGELVAATLGIPPTDVDAAILSVTGQTVRDLWTAGGESAYRGLERDVVLDTLASSDSTVLAVPAGAICEPSVRAALRGPAVFTVWLRAEVDTLVARLGDAGHRPLLDGDPAVVLREQARARAGHYGETADLAIEVDHRGPREVTEQIVACLRAATSNADPAS